MGLVLKMARQIIDGKPGNHYIQTLIILPKDLLTFSAFDVEILDGSASDKTDSKGEFLVYRIKKK